MRDNMRVIGKGACDPCANDWKLKIKELWERYQEIVRSIKADGRTYYPDGQGQVELPGILSDVILTDMTSYYNLTIDTEVSVLNLVDQTTYWQLTIES